MIKKLNSNKLNNEKGSMSIEFIGILPFLFLFMLLLWQVVASGVAIISTQSAVNEAAKVYAVSQDVDEARTKAQEIVGSGDFATYTSFSIPSIDSNGSFDAQLNVNLYLAFLPDDWKDDVPIPFSITTSSRVMDND